MKHLVISYHSCPLAEPGQDLSGGMNIFLRGLLPALPMPTEVWTAGAQAQTLEMAPGVTLRRIPCGFSRPWTRERAWECLPAFLANLPETGAEVVSAHYWMSGLAARRLRRPWVMMFHTLQQLRGGPDTLDRAAQERQLAAEADFVVFLSALDQRRSQSVLPPLRARVIRPGVTLGPSRQPGPIRIFLMAARDEPAKNVPSAIAAVESVGAQLWIAGQTGIDTPHVRFLGTVPHAEMGRLYSQVDAVLCPSDYESFGLVTLEALAHGLPVVVNANGGYWGRVGRALKTPTATSLERLPQALRELRPDPQAARALAARFTWKRAAQRWDALLRDAARSGRAGRRAHPPD